MKKLLAALLVFISFQAVSAQLSINYLKESLPIIKNNTTYVVIGDLDSPEAKVYMDLYKKYWTISKIEFIAIEDMRKHYKENTPFITFSKVDESIYSSKGSIDYTSYEWDLWICNARGVKKLDKEGPYYHRDKVANYQLTFTYGGNGDGKNKYFEPEEAIEIFKPGNAKNVIQWVNACLEDGQEFQYGNSFTDKAELDNLKKGTLYVPKEIFDTPADITEFFAKYPYKYEVVSLDDLDDKIMEDEDGFYYLHFLCTRVYRVPSVINSKTGKVIYARNMIALASKVKIIKRDIETLTSTIGK